MASKRQNYNFFYEKVQSFSQICNLLPQFARIQQNLKPMENQLHTAPLKEIFKTLKTSDNGLSKQEVTKRLKQYGPNEIREVNKITWYHILFSQFANIMVGILAVAIIISASIGELIDAIAIGIILVLNSIIGFIQEYKAEKAVDALKKSTPNKTFVIRDGEEMEIFAKDLVPGDILVLEEGTAVPADARLISVSQLYTIESSLTGESHPVEKNPDKKAASQAVADLINMVFLGTVIAKGRGKAVVIRTGMETEFGKIALLVQTEDEVGSPLQESLNRITKYLALIAVIVAFFLFLFSLIMGRDLVEMLLLSISLAVSVIPEGLPVIITLTLAIGAQQMAKRNAILRKLKAAETLGSTSVICTDKTGTLTQNEMTVQVLYANSTQYSISGTGYEPLGEFFEGKKKIAPLQNPELEKLLIIGSLCNNSKLKKEGSDWKILGDPTEGSLLTLSEKAGLKLKDLEEKFPRTEELVFDSERKRMSTIHKGAMYTKGSPDLLLNVCKFIQINGEIKPLTEKDKKKILEKNNNFAENAYRVLGFAYKTIKAKEKTEEKDLIFIGLAGMIDPPRPEVKDAIAKCHRANIKVVMITGDHALTAKAIAEEIGLYKKNDKIVTGQELEAMTDAELAKNIEKIRIYARVNPYHKVRILQAFKSKNHIVAMTGDGVNDAPALKIADIGVAMGITGTDVSKQASDLILTDDNFATIVAAIERGRIIYENIKKFIRYLLSANFDEILVIVIVFAVGNPMPFIPLQILWVNILTDALPAIALGMDTPEENIMSLKPRDPKESIIKKILAFSFIAGIISTAITLIVYFEGLKRYSFEEVRTLVFTTIVMFEIFLVFSIRYERHGYFKNFFKNKILLASVVISFLLQLFAIYNPFMQKVLKTVPISLYEWIFISGLCIIGIIMIEIWKRFTYRRNT